MIMETKHKYHCNHQINGFADDTRFYIITYNATVGIESILDAHSTKYTGKLFSMLLQNDDGMA